jgi:hypothetical protein
LSTIFWSGRSAGLGDRLDGRVARGFRRVDRDQQFLLPVDMREWLPGDHVVWVLLEVVDHLDITELEARYAQGGPGRRAYDPRMLLALLIMRTRLESVPHGRSSGCAGPTSRCG